VRFQDWTGFAALPALVGGIAMLASGRPVWGGSLVAVGGGLAGLTRWWSQKYPGPLPYALRWTLRVPRGSHSPRHLQRVLSPRAGERILEIGPGIGIHALPVARSLAPAGTLDVLDLQQEMLDDVMRRAGAAGIANIVPRRASVHTLPYPDGAFDGAYLVGVLGEIPDAGAALRELRRVLKPEGRLVIGEVCFDPDFVFLRSLQEMAAAAGFEYERRVGGSLSYLARFRPATPAAS
jgi:SAM-dependent methyltransferase